MPSNSDVLIFVTGVVGRAMGSGKFGVGEIEPLAKNAKDAFVAVFGPVEQPQPYQAPAPRPQAAPPARVGASQHIGLTARDVASQAGMTKGGSIPPTSEASFHLWGGRKAYYGSKKWEAWGKPWPEVTWEELLEHASSNDTKSQEKANKALKVMADSEPQEGEWAERSRQKIANAKCVLLMARKLMEAPRQPTQEQYEEEPNPDEGDRTPF